MTERPEQTPPPEGFVPPAAGQPDPDIVDAEILEGDVVEPDGQPEGDLVEGEVVEPSTVEAAEVDALLAEALDADAIEAEFSAAEADMAAAAGGSGAVAEQVAILTTDLQRVHAEYSNYRKRVERDRELVRERAVESALVELLPILDDIGRARDHDELVGGFRSVGEALEAAVVRLGLTPFGDGRRAVRPDAARGAHARGARGRDRADGGHHPAGRLRDERARRAPGSRVSRRHRLTDDRREEVRVR